MDLILGLILVVIAFHVLMGMLMAVTAVGWVIWRTMQDIVRDWPIGRHVR